MKLLFVDVETSGLDSKTHGITQIALILANLSGTVVSVLDRQTWEMALLPGDMVTPKALEVQGRTLEQVRAAPDPHHVKRAIDNLLNSHVNKFDPADKLFFMAYNAPFDAGFVRSWFTKQGDKFFGSWFGTPPICIMQQAAVHLMNRRHHMKDFKLATVANELGVSLHNAHDAGADVEAAFQIWLKVNHFTELIDADSTPL